MRTVVTTNRYPIPSASLTQLYACYVLRFPFRLDVCLFVSVAIALLLMMSASVEEKDSSKGDGLLFKIGELHYEVRACVCACVCSCSPWIDWMCNPFVGTSLLGKICWVARSTIYREQRNRFRDALRLSDALCCGRICVFATPRICTTRRRKNTK